jgi:hypothetical protein
MASEMSSGTVSASSGKTHLDVLVQPQAAQDGPRLGADPVGQEDVAAVVPVEPLRGGAVGVSADPVVLLQEGHRQAGPGQPGGGRQAGHARADDHDVASALAHRETVPLAMHRLQLARARVAALSAR